MAGYKIKVNAVEVPKMYRTLEIPDTLSFLDLHRVLMAAFSWNGLNIELQHTFSFDDVYISAKEEEDERDREESRIGVSAVIDKSDFKDNLFTVERDIRLNIHLVEKLPKHPDRVVTVTEAVGTFDLTSPKIESRVSSKAIDLALLNEKVSAVRIKCSPTSFPTVDELKEASLKDMMDIVDSYGINFKNILDNLEKRSDYAPQLPLPPKDPDHPNPMIALADKDFKEHPDQKVRITMGTKSISELLSQLSMKNLYDYCKYLALYDDIQKDNKQKALSIADAFFDDPALLLYPADTSEDMDVLLKLPSLASKEESISGVNFAWMCLIGLGEYREDHTFAIARDLPALLESLNQKTVVKHQNLFKQYDHDIDILIKHYGLIEIAAVQDLLDSTFHLQLTKLQTHRLIHFRTQMNHRAVTFTCTIGIQILYMATPEMIVQPDLQNLLMHLNTCSDMAPYAPIPDFQLSVWEQGKTYMEVFPGWSYINGLLRISSMLPEDEVKSYLDELYQAVRFGKTYQECLELLNFSETQLKQVFFRTRFWEIIMHAILGTALPGLKGANHIIAMQDPRYTVFPGYTFSSTIVDEANVKSSTPVDALPSDIQIKIASCLYTLEPSDLAIFRNVLRRFPNNIDLNYLTGIACLRLDQFEDALRYFERCERLLKGSDSSIQQAINMAKNQHRDILPSMTSDGLLFM